LRTPEWRLAERCAGLCCSLLFACSSAKSGVSSHAPQHDLAACDAGSPAALAAARSVVAKRCASCHSPDGIAGSDYDWTNEHSLVVHRRNVAAQVAQGSMPPAGYPRPTPEEQQALLCWANGR
jgi:mono/diheme cytochrome c family protein